MVSIIIPNYNHTKALAKCLDSIQSQTFRDFEIIIVDDGSNAESKKDLLEIVELIRKPAVFRGSGSVKLATPDTPVYLERKNSQIKILYEEHQGANAARNSGAREARGEYLLFCDADIIMKPVMLSEMIHGLEKNPAAAYAYSSFNFGWKLFKLWSFDAEKLKKNNYIHTTSLLRKEWFPGFDESLKRFQDWDLWLTILEKGGRGVWIPEVLFTILPHKGGMSKWMPSFFYKIPWQKIGIQPKSLREYDRAREVVLNKHKL